MLQNWVVEFSLYANRRFSPDMISTQFGHLDATNGASGTPGGPPNRARYSRRSLQLLQQHSVLTLGAWVGNLSSTFPQLHLIDAIITLLSLQQADGNLYSLVRLVNAREHNSRHENGDDGAIISDANYR